MLCTMESEASEESAGVSSQAVGSKSARRRATCASNHDARYCYSIPECLMVVAGISRVLMESLVGPESRRTYWKAESSALEE